MAAQRATAAEKTAPAGSMVMLGDVLGLGRAGSGCMASGGPGGRGVVDPFVLLTPGSGPLRFAQDPFVLLTPYITGCRYG